MFQGERYLTQGVNQTIPMSLQMLLWECIDHMDVEKDYLQIFQLSVAENGNQVICHEQEKPEYQKTYSLAVPFPAIDAKIYVIDDYYADENKHVATMLLAEEY
ncbi:DUF960 family protein [Ruminococcus sp.]|uniref:DUF960 family protein n=1 Tax=Ruminococcus sp. TaxID=41978 RepID=UPI0025D97692|nr:DUF960 family protein [Ruminococcus sp.]